MAEDNIRAEQLLAEIEDVIRTMPSRQMLGRHTTENLVWFGRATAVVERWDFTKAPTFQQARRLLALDSTGVYGEQSFQDIVVILHQAQNDLRMQTAGPVNMAVGQGRVFEYFDELRKTIELAAQDIFFVDPYLDAEFISRYLPHVHAGVVIRLLTSEKKLTTLLPAVDLFCQQNGRMVNVRAASTGLHDRYLFIDNGSCYQSGASFKDGARNAPTTLTQITDAFDAVWRTYEAMWAGGRVHR
jgi:hypothetical protein